MRKVLGWGGRGGPQGVADEEGGSRDVETVSWAEYGRGGQNIAQCGEPEQRCVERRAEGGGRRAGSGVARQASDCIFGKEEERQRAVGLRSLKLVSCPSGCGSGPSTLAQGCPRCSMAFALLPVCIYLFIAFYGVSFPSNSYCLCCPDHPLGRPAVCAALCLSVTREIKTASGRT